MWVNDKITTITTGEVQSLDPIGVHRRSVHPLLSKGLAHVQGCSSGRPRDILYSHQVCYEAIPGRRGTGRKSKATRVTFYPICVDVNEICAQDSLPLQDQPPLAAELVRILFKNSIESWFKALILGAGAAASRWARAGNNYQCQLDPFSFQVFCFIAPGEGSSDSQSPCTFITRASDDTVELVARFPSPQDLEQHLGSKWHQYMLTGHRCASHPGSAADNGNHVSMQQSQGFSIVAYGPYELRIKMQDPDRATFSCRCVALFPDKSRIPSSDNRL